METIIGVGIWVMIFLVWYARTYPEKLKSVFRFQGLKVPWPGKKKRKPPDIQPPAIKDHDFKLLVEKIEKICARDRFMASDAASMVEAVKRILQIEPASGQIWEAYALDSLEGSEIVCDDCRVPVDKIVKKTGVRIQCTKCGKWLALKNSKVTVIDPSRPDLEDWEKFH